MEYVPFVISADSVTLTLHGKTVIINRSSGYYEETVDAIREKNWDLVRELSDRASHLERASKGMFRVVDGIVYVDDEVVPNSLNNKIISFLEEGLPFEPLVEFWKNLRDNPSSRSRNRLFDFLNNNGHPITEDGCFITYKRVSNDFRDIRTGNYDNSIGSIVEMDRSLVDDDPEHTCSSGLHVASRPYASDDYYHGTGRLVYCKVNPRDVVAIPVDYNNQKMRVCRYEVIAEDEGERTETLFDRKSPSSNSNPAKLYYDGYDLGFKDGQYVISMVSGTNSELLQHYLSSQKSKRNIHNESDAYIRGYEQGFKDGWNHWRDEYSEDEIEMADEDDEDFYE